MGTMDTNIPDRVRQFVCDFWRENPHRLRADTRLEEDLVMTGIEFHKHFGPECGPILFWPRGLAEEMKDLGNYPVTVGHLVEVAAAKRWSCPPPRGEKKWPGLPPYDLWDRELDG